MGEGVVVQWGGGNYIDEKKQVLVRIVLVGNARPFLLQGIKQL